MPHGDEPVRAGPSTGPVVLAWAIAAGCFAAAVLGIWLSLGHGESVPWRSLVIPLIWSIPAALIAAARPRVALGWLNLGVAVLFSAMGLAEAWLRAGPEGMSVLTALALWYVERGGAAIVPVSTLALVLLPDSRLPSPRWRLPVVTAVTMQVVLVAMWSLSATTAAAPGSDWQAALAVLRNPLGILPAEWASRADEVVWLLQLPLLLCVAAMVARVRRSRGIDRARLMSPVLALAVFAVVVLAGRALWAPVADVVDVLASLLLGGVLVAAVLRRHLDGVTVVVHHAFVATVLGAAVAGAYIGAVALLASWVPELSHVGAGVVAAVVALLVQPLRARLQRWVDQVMRGDRRDPYAALSRLAEHAHRAPTLEEVLMGVATSVASSLRVPQVVVEAFGVRAVHPSGEPHPVPGELQGGLHGGSRIRVPLVAGDRRIGSLTALPQLGRRLRADEERLLVELGRHAGLAVDSIRLAGEVAEHHRALVAAREEERRRLGRELHDELGPTIAGLSMQLGALRPLVHGDPDAVVARLATLEQAASVALADIRRVAHELRPPVLDHLGLTGAVRQAAESLDLTPVEEDIEHEALPAAVELAVYRIMTEALSNVARHSGVRTVRLSARETGSCLLVMVADDGRGPGESGYGGVGAGLGCVTMRERAEELGGTLTIRSGDRGGTVVTAVLPLTTAPGSGQREERR